MFHKSNIEHGLKNIIFLYLFLYSPHIFAFGSWTQQSTPVTTDLNAVCAVSNNICWICGVNNVIIKTTNSGILWTLANSGLSGNFYCISAIDAFNAWAGTDDGKIWRTSNGGLNWSYSIPSPVTSFIDGVHMFNLSIGVALGDPVNGNWRFYMTTDGGITWNLAPGNPRADSSETGWSNSFWCLDTGNIWWGTNRSRIWKGSLRGGFNSTFTSAVNSYAISFYDNYHGLASQTTYNDSVQNNIRTSDGGNTWVNGLFTPAGIQYGIACSPGSGYPYFWTCGAGISGGNIYISTDYGETFVIQFSGIVQGNAASCISMANINCGWAATFATSSSAPSGKIYRFTDSLIGIQNKYHNIPRDYYLSQNFPNHFNPSTSINFSIPVASFVNLKIYDVLGKLILTYAEGYRKAGNYTIIIDAPQLSSGIYYYKITAGVFQATKKMVLCK